MFVDLVGSGPATLITGASVAHRPKRRFCGVPTQAWGEDPAEGFGEEGRGTCGVSVVCRDILWMTSMMNIDEHLWHRTPVEERCEPVYSVFSVKSVWTSWNSCSSQLDQSSCWGWPLAGPVDSAAKKALFECSNWPWQMMHRWSQDVCKSLLIEIDCSHQSLTGPGNISTIDRLLIMVLSVFCTAMHRKI
jgi:hypothetical protein